MRKFVTPLLAFFVIGALPIASHAATTSQVESGMTSVVFGNGALAALGLSITGVDDGTIAPGDLGSLSVAFPILERSEGTSFEYDNVEFAPFSGTIEHQGSVTFTDAETSTAEITVGDFTIGYDENRSDSNPDASGFFVQDNLDLGAILFDITDPIVEAFDRFAGHPVEYRRLCRV